MVAGAGGDYAATGGGGSSYISGHTGCVAITSANSLTPKNNDTTGTTNQGNSVHYSGYQFTDTVMIDGLGYGWTNEKGALQQMPNPSGGLYGSNRGNSGNGYAKITFLGREL